MSCTPVKPTLAAAPRARRSAAARNSSSGGGTTASPTSDSSSASAPAALSGEITVLTNRTDLVQNGGADGVALVSAADLVLDSLSYEGDAYYKGTQLLREGATSTTSLADSNTVNGSIGRIPNGTDSNANAADFTVNSAPTPGAPNQP